MTSRRRFFSPESLLLGYVYKFRLKVCYSTLDYRPPEFPAHTQKEKTTPITQNHQIRSTSNVVSTITEK